MRSFVWGSHTAAQYSNDGPFAGLGLCWCFKLNSYSNTSVFSSLCRMRISVFWGHERLSDRSISKHYPKSDITPWVEKSSASRAFCAHDTGLIHLNENATAHCKALKNASVQVWIQLYMMKCPVKCTCTAKSKSYRLYSIEVCGFHLQSFNCLIQNSQLGLNKKMVVCPFPMDPIYLKIRDSFFLIFFSQLCILKQKC